MTAGDERQYLGGGEFFCRCLRINSLQNFQIKYLGWNIPLKYGPAKKFDKIKVVQQELSRLLTIYNSEEQQNIVILFIDGKDVITQVKQTEIIKAFNLWNKTITRNQLIFSAEKHCWPQNMLFFRNDCKDYPQPTPISPEGKLYLNAGAWIGRLNVAYNVFTFISSMINPFTEIAEDDQAIIQRVFLNTH
eukprot:255865_1